MPKPPERVGLFGGTFDPIHNGHLAVSVNVRHALALDRVLLVVANRPWQKLGRPSLTDARDRLAMVEAAVDGIDGLEASPIEIDRGGDTYTADTVEEVTRVWPRAGVFLVVGTDVAADLGTWMRVDVIRESTTLALVDRPGAPVPALPGWRVQHVDVPQVAVSSSDLRSRAAGGLPLEGLVPAAVVRFIRDRGLYAERG